MWRPATHSATIYAWLGVSHCARGGLGTGDGRRGLPRLDSQQGMEEVGYIHLSFAHQVKQVADALYRGREDLLLLEIDPAELKSPLIVEDLDGSGERFPHVYGELNLDAVQGTRPLRPRSDGTFDAVADAAP